MANAPYRFIDRRGQSNGGNQLYQAASQHPERENYPDLARDTQKNISDLGRRTLMTLGRKMFADYPALEGVTLEQANLSVGTFLPQHYALTNRTWSRLAESWLVDEWLPICDLRGSPYDGDTYLELHVISELRDGDMGTLLTETSQGYPAIQIIPSHRIRSPLGANHTVKVRFYQDQMWVNGVLIDQRRPYVFEDPVEWDAPIFDGVILGPFGQPLAYRICDDGYGYASHVDVPARNLFLNFHPKWADQARGFAAFGSGAWDWQDVKESRRFDLVAQKVAAALYAIETNETGQSNAAMRTVQAAVFNQETGAVETPQVQEMKGGIRYLRAGSGSKIEFPTVNRPGQQVQQFQETIIRDALAGAEWSYIFGVDPSKAGGASLRIVVDRINRVLEKRRKSPAKSFRRVIGYAIAKAMQLRILPWNDEWWMWEFQGPGRMTADRKYDSDVDQAEIDAGLSTRKIACARRGVYHEDIDDQTEAEADSRIERAMRVSKKRSIDWREAYAIMWPPKASVAKTTADPESEPDDSEETPTEPDTAEEES
jgi:hypothetical protein